MSRRFANLALVAVCVAGLSLSVTACSRTRTVGDPVWLPPATASSSAGGPAAPSTPAPNPSPSPSPSASDPPAKPKPSTKPKPKPAGTAATGKVTAASLGIPGAGTLKIPAWPDHPGDRWRGPVGSQGSTGTSAVALTFDDGPGPYTSRVLDLLDKYHIKATFCMIGRQIHAYRTVVKRMIDDGMTLCNHSWDHDENIRSHSAAYIAKNLQRTIDAVHAIDPGATVAYFRNPGGNFTAGTVRVSELLGMRALYWSVDTDDWTRPGVAAIEKTLRTKTHQDSIVLMHDAGGDRSETISALQVMLPWLKEHFHLIALPTARTVRVDPGKPAPVPPVPPSSAPPADVPATGGLTSRATTP